MIGLINIIYSFKDVFDTSFLTYEKTYLIKKLNITAKHEKISYFDLRKAVGMMLKNILIVDGEARKLEVKNILY